jgi:CheY-like chemotaxis protein
MTKTGTMTIVCADDSVTMQTVAEITFRATEFEYVGARSADEALKAARERTPVLVLADAVMPGKTGYDLCEAIKAELPDVPVMMMCGNSQPYDPTRGAKAGVDGHVTKPWDTQVMLDKVRELLERVGAEGVTASDGAKAPASAPKPEAAAPAAAAPSAPKPAAPKPPAAAAKPAAAQTLASKPAAAQAPARPAASAPARPSAPSASQPSSGVPAIPKPGPAATLSGPAVRPSKPAPAPAERSVPEPIAPARSSQSSLGAPLEARSQRPTSPGASDDMDDEPTRSQLPAGSIRPSAAPRAATVPPATAPAKSQAAKGMPRPPMIRGTPARRPTVPPQSRQVAEGARSAGLAAGRSPTLMGMPMLQMPPGQRKVPEGVTPVATGGVDARGGDLGAASAAVEAKTSAAISERASQVAQEAGIDPSGPEMAALVKLSREVVERVVWEVVPDLAETIIRENLDRLASKSP